MGQQGWNSQQPYLPATNTDGTCVDGRRTQDNSRGLVEPLGRWWYHEQKRGRLRDKQVNGGEENQEFGLGSADAELATWASAITIGAACGRGGYSFFLFLQCAMMLRVRYD